MIYGPRPTLGWFGYLIIGKSWYRLAFVLVTVAIITLFIIDEGQKVVTLRHSTPSPFPPPVIFVHSPENTYLTPFDACAVEAATKTEEDRGRGVYVYLWRDAITPGDVWENWVLRLPRVHLTHMELNKLLMQTNLEGLRKMNTKGPWQRWLAARLALLWKYGGIVMSFGTFMTSPLSVGVLDPHMGILLEGRNGQLDPTVISTPSRHKIISGLADYYYNIHTTMATTPEKLLTKAAKDACDINNIHYLPLSDCKDIHYVTKRNIASIGEGPRDISKPLPDATFVMYPDLPYTYLDDTRFHKLFEMHEVKKFCPQTAKYLEQRTRSPDRV